MLKYLFAILLLIVVGGSVLAQSDVEIPPSDAESDLLVTADDLEVDEPGLLPDSKFYFLKNWGRAIRSVFAFGKLKKAEMKLKFTSERLLEIEQLALKKSSALQKALQKYEEELENIDETTEDMTTTTDEAGKFLNKFTQHQALHLRILDKLETQVPTSTMERIRETREKHLENFAQVMEKLENKAKIGETLEENLDELEGSDFKEFKNIEVLKRVEEKVPEKAKESIQNAITNSLNKLEKKLDKMTEEEQERFRQYAEELIGVEETKAEILEDLKMRFQNEIQIRQKLEETGERIREKVREKVENETGQNCPVNISISCSGRVVTEEDDDGCPQFRCVEAENDDSCVMVWDPVCGVDGKTYSNECVIGVKGVEVDYEGECEGPGKKKGQDTTSMNDEDEHYWVPVQIETIEVIGVGMGTSSNEE